MEIRRVNFRKLALSTCIDDELSVILFLLTSYNKSYSGAFTIPQYSTNNKLHIYINLSQIFIMIAYLVSK